MVSRPPKGSRRNEAYKEKKSWRKVSWDVERGWELYCRERHADGRKFDYTDVAQKLDCSVTAVRQYGAKHKWVKKRAQELLENPLGGFGGEPGEIIVEGEIISETDPVAEYDEKWLEGVRDTRDQVSDQFTELWRLAKEEMMVEITCPKCGHEHYDMRAQGLNEHEQRAKIIASLTKSLETLQKMQRTSHNLKTGSGINVNILNAPAALPQAQVEARRTAIDLANEMAALPAPEAPEVKNSRME